MQAGLRIGQVLGDDSTPSQTCGQIVCLRLSFGDDSTPSQQQQQIVYCDQVWDGDDSTPSQSQLRLRIV